MYFQLAQDMLRRAGCPERGKQRPTTACEGEPTNPTLTQGSTLSKRLGREGSPGVLSRRELRNGDFAGSQTHPHPVTPLSLKSNSSPFVITQRTYSKRHWKAGPKAQGLRERSNGSKPKPARNRDLAVP